MMPVRLEPAAPLSQVKHSTTEPLRSHYFICAVVNPEISKLFELMDSFFWFDTIDLGLSIVNI